MIRPLLSIRLLRNLNSSRPTLLISRNQKRFIFRNASPIPPPRTSSLSPSSAVNIIIFLNISVFGAWKLSESDYTLRNILYKHFTVSSRGVLRDHRYHTCITACFSHKDFFHLLANMFTLYFCGPTVAAIVGTRSFVALYLCSGIFSSICHVSAPYIIPKSFPSYWKISTNDRALGASGSVSSIVTFFCISNPSAIIHLWGILPVPAALLGIGFIGYDFMGLYHGGNGIGNAAHLGGAAFGALAFLRMKLKK